MRKTQLYKIIFLALFWEACFVFILFFEGIVTGYNPITPDAIPFTFPTLFSAILLSFTGASFTASFEVLFLSKRFRKKPFGKILLYKTLIYLINMEFWFSVIVIIKTSLDFGEPVYDMMVMERYIRFLFSQRNLISIIYWGFTTSLGLSVLQVSDKFGQGILVNFLIGKYHQPKVENHNEY